MRRLPLLLQPHAERLEQRLDSIINDQLPDYRCSTSWLEVMRRWDGDSELKTTFSF